MVIAVETAILIYCEGKCKLAQPLQKPAWRAQFKETELYTGQSASCVFLETLAHFGSCDTKGSRAAAHSFPRQWEHIRLFVTTSSLGCPWIFCSLHSLPLLYVSSLLGNHTLGIGEQDTLHFRWSLANLSLRVPQSYWFFETLCGPLENFGFVREKMYSFLQSLQDPPPHYPVVKVLLLPVFCWKMGSHGLYTTVITRASRRPDKCWQ